MLEIQYSAKGAQFIVIVVNKNVIEIVNQNALTQSVKFHQIVCSVDVCHVDNVGFVFAVALGSTLAIGFVHDGEVFLETSLEYITTAFVWTHIRWVPSLNRLILSCADGIYVSEVITSNQLQLKVAKTKLQISSEIGPQNRLLALKEKNVIVDVHVVHPITNDSLFTIQSEHFIFFLVIFVYRF